MCNKKITIKNMKSPRLHTSHKYKSNPIFYVSFNVKIKILPMLYPENIC